MKRTIVYMPPAFTQQLVVVSSEHAFHRLFANELELRRHLMLGTTTTLVPLPSSGSVTPYGQIWVSVLIQDITLTEFAFDHA